MFGLHIIHTARREISRPYGIADIRQINRVLGTAAAHLLQAEDAFIADEVRIFILQSYRCECSVEIHDNLVLGSLLNNALVEIGHPLVCMIHEVYLHGWNAPLGIGLEQRVEVLLNGEPRQPQCNLHALGVAVLYQIRQTQVIVAMERITGGLGPTFVEQDVVDTELSGKIGEIAVGLVVATETEVYIRTEGGCTVPPFP